MKFGFGKPVNAIVARMQSKRGKTSQSRTRYLGNWVIVRGKKRSAASPPNDQHLVTQRKPRIREDELPKIWKQRLRYPIVFRAVGTGIIQGINVSRTVTIVICLFEQFGSFLEEAFIDRV